MPELQTNEQHNLLEVQQQALQAFEQFEADIEREGSEDARRVGLQALSKNMLMLVLLVNFASAYANNRRDEEAFAFVLRMLNVGEQTASVIEQVDIVKNEMDKEWHQCAEEYAVRTATGGEERTDVVLANVGPDPDVEALGEPLPWEVPQFNDNGPSPGESDSADQCPEKQRCFCREAYSEDDPPFKLSCGNIVGKSCMQKWITTVASNSRSAGLNSSNHERIGQCPSPTRLLRFSGAVLL
ncbi:uncharacterized protein BDZ99DRAFT_459198 [Mytilinidion resinicola]|uniref:Uncharacterized protein n=1 Tax=Mytilinidion resinicola TaxID=574789 RepID=A0A6A6Z528_9PEZI|nr:uncharacterized protein BDZ99DRAFT_459198 [Mytilinidion resinicola]KAF2815285.1 hypothetical protein BDZ99DRAFT_459198 [Mytilinidion resinicola]